MVAQSIAERIAQRQRQYLVNCCLYYELSETIVSDPTYWRHCDDLIDLQARYPEEAKSTPYYELTRDLDTTYSYPPKCPSLRHYPPEIVTAAMRLLAIRDGVALQTVARRYGFDVENRNEREAK